MRAAGVALSSVDDAIDLVWYYNFACGEIGVPSSYGAMVARLQMGTQVQSYASSEEAENHIEQRIDACRRYDRIGQMLQRLDDQTCARLELAYETCAIPFELRLKPPHHYHLACRSIAARSAAEALHLEWSVKTASNLLVLAVGDTASRSPDLRALDRAAWSEAEQELDSLLKRFGAARTGRRLS